MNRKERRASASVGRQANKNHIIASSRPRLLNGSCVAPEGEALGGGIHILAENRAKAPATFVLHVFNEEPSYNRASGVHRPGYDFKREKGYLFTVESTGETLPGYAFKLDLEIAEAFFEENERGPKAWFTVPFEIRGVFFLHYLVLNSKNMLARPGTL